MEPRLSFGITLGQSDVLYVTIWHNEANIYLVITLHQTLF